MKKKSAIGLIAIILLIIGGLNWGIVGIFNWNLVAAIFGGATSVLTRLIYVLVGLAAIVKIVKMLMHKPEAK